jgi:hypothetical protein
MHDRRRRRTVPLAAPLLVIAAAFLAACGSPGPTTSPVEVTTGPTTPPITQVPVTLAPVTAPPVTAAPPTAAAGTPACTPADLKVSHGLVEGAAGSRLTEIVLVASSVCTLDLYPTLGLRDKNNNALVGGTAGGSGQIEVSPAGSYTSEVRLGNWCAPDPAFPLTLELRLGSDELQVTGSSFPEQGGLPPCVGDGGPILEAGAWTAGT